MPTVTRFLQRRAAEALCTLSALNVALADTAGGDRVAMALLPGWELSAGQASASLGTDKDGAHTVLATTNTSELTLRRELVSNDRAGVFLLARLQVTGSDNCVRLLVTFWNATGVSMDAYGVDGPCVQSSETLQPAALAAEVPADAREVAFQLRSFGASRVTIARLLSGPVSEAYGALAPEVPPATLAALQDTEARVRAANKNPKTSWALVRAKALSASVGVGPGRRDALPGVRQLMRSLGDGHSGAALRNEAGQFLDATGKPYAFVRPEFDIQDDGQRRVVSIRVPHMASVNGQDEQRYALDLREALVAAVTGHACAAIVDLRQHTGGNMWPGLNGLGPLIGVGEVGSFRPGPPWVVSAAERATVDGRPVTSAQPAMPWLAEPADWPVAVLIGPKTASSGEAVAISFSGRPRTRFFGQRTRGLATSNEMVDLREGLTLFLMVSRMADRDGKLFPAGVIPDEEVDDHHVEAAARAWIGKQSSCEELGSGRPGKGAPAVSQFTCRGVLFALPLHRPVRNDGNRQQAAARIRCQAVRHCAAGNRRRQNLGLGRAPRIECCAALACHAPNGAFRPRDGPAEGLGIEPEWAAGGRSRLGDGGRTRYCRIDCQRHWCRACLLSRHDRDRARLRRCR